MSTTIRSISYDPEWGHITIKISGHPPFPAYVLRLFSALAPRILKANQEES